MTEALPDRMNAATLAAYWDTTPGQLANLRSRGEGPPYIKLGSRVLYRREDIEAYEASHLVTAVAA